MLERRLQVLIDDECHARLIEAARKRRVSVATVVRDAIDRELGPAARREAAGRRLLDAPDMEVGVADLKAELDELRGRRA